MSAQGTGEDRPLRLLAVVVGGQLDQGQDCLLYTSMNSTVRCREESSGKEYTLTLVYPEDVAGEGKVSILAPVGTALLGLTIGQTIDWPAPSGKTLKLTLLEIEYQPEAAGDYAR